MLSRSRNIALSQIVDHHKVQINPHSFLPRGFGSNPGFVDTPVAHPLPSIPRKIDLHDVLNENSSGQLMHLSPETVIQIQHALHDAKDGKYTKKDLLNLGIRSSYSVIKSGDKFYTVYHGEKQKKLCGKGTTANLKFAQDMDTGDLILVKIRFSTNLYTPEICRKRSEMEYQILEQLNMALGTFERISPSKGFQIITLIKFTHGVTLQYYLKFFEHFQRSISMHHALDITIQFCDALDQLHRIYKIMHRDLNKENIVYDYAQKELKLIDFGYSRPLESDDDYGTQYEFRKANYILKDLWNNVFLSPSAIPKQNRFLQSARDYIAEQMQPSFTQTNPFLRSKVFFAELRGIMPPDQYMHGLINVRDYLKENERQRIIDDLKKYDLVSIQDDKPTKGAFPVHHYLALKRELENRGLLVSNSVYLKRHGTFAEKTPQIAAVEPPQHRKDF